MNILIAVPCMDSVPAQFAQSLAMLKKVGNSAVAFQVGSLIYSARNDLAKKAIEMGSDYMLWLDSDMVFNPDSLEKAMDLMNKHKLDILSGVYYRRAHPYSPVLLEKLEMEPDKCDFLNLMEVPEEEVFEVAGCGFGFVLLKTEVLIDVFSTYSNMFAPISGVGEDLSFCWRARQCGYKIYATPEIPLGHVGHITVTKSFYDAYNKKA